MRWDRQAPDGARSQGVLRRVEATMVVAVCIGLALTWALSIARYGGPDEPAHVLRAASVASGEVLGGRVDGLPPGYRSIEVDAALASGDPRCFRHDPNVAATCAHADPDASGRTRAASSAGDQPPLYAAVVGVPTRALGHASSVLWHRAVAAVVVGATLALAILRARERAATVLIAMPPAAWFLSGVVNPNAIEMALAALSWVGAAVMLRDPPARTSEALWVAVPLAVMIVMRPIAFVTAVAVLGAIVIARRPTSRASWMALIGPPVGAVLAVGLWSIGAGVRVEDERTAADVDRWRALRRSVGLLDDRIAEIPRLLGWREFGAPWIAAAGWWVIVIGAVIVGLRVVRSATIWIIAAVALTPIAFEMVFADRVGFIWQGRYSAPAAMGVVVVALGTNSWAPPTWLRRAALALACIVELLTLWFTLWRYTVGVNGSMLFTGQKWRPPVPVLALVITNAALMTGLAVLIDRRSSPTPTKVSS